MEDIAINLEDREFKKNLLPSLNSQNNLFDGNKSTRSTSDKSSPFYKNKSNKNGKENKESFLYELKTPNKIELEDHKTISSTNSASRALNPIKKSSISLKSPNVFESAEIKSNTNELQGLLLQQDLNHNKLLLSSKQILKLKTLKENDVGVSEFYKDKITSNNKLQLVKKIESNREVNANYFNKKSKLSGSDKTNIKKVLNDGFVIKLKVLSVNLCKENEEINQLLNLCKINQDTIIESLFIDHVFMYKLENLFSKDATSVTKQKKEKFLLAEIKKALEYYSLDAKFKVNNQQMNKDINEHLNFLKNFDFFAK